MRYFFVLLFGVSVSVASAQDTTVKIVKKNDTTLELRHGADLVASYQHGGTVKLEKADGTKPLAKPFFYPLIAPNGMPVTRDWPMVRGKAGETTDHFHQKSVWFCHGDVVPEGIELKTKSSDKHVKGVDFWAEGAGHGRIVCTRISEPQQLATNHAKIGTINEWRTPDDVTILVENRTIHFTTLPQGRLIVLDIELLCPIASVTFDDTKEGAMGVRVPDEFTLTRKGSEGVITSSDGKTVKAPARDNLPMWGHAADWNDYVGTVEGKTAGLAVFDDAKNKYRSAWHTRAYGLMAANPFARNASGFPGMKDQTELVKLKKGESVKLRYGIYAHTGTTVEGKVAEAYKVFSAMK